VSSAQLTAYCAHPKTCYGSDHARHHLDALAALLPGVEVIDPEGCPWTSEAQWLADWQDIVARLDVLVAFGDESGTVGCGVLREITDCLLLGVPIAVLDLAGPTLRDLHAVELVPEVIRWAGQAAVLVPGAPCERPPCSGHHVPDQGKRPSRLGR
jgi:hypothetical protein